MRDIKFRAWHKKHGMIEPTLAGIDVYRLVLHDGVHYIEFDNNEDVPIYLEDYVIMQYTGLKDKNGVEIYEGDILKFISARRHDTSFNASVVFEKGSFVDSKCKWYLSDGAYTLEVIGNIYEHSHLLDK